MIDVWIKTGLGKGPEYMFTLPAVPRVGDEIYLNGMIREVTRVLHDIDNLRVVVFTR